MTDTVTAIHDRISAQHFDASRSLSDDLIKKLVAAATEAPSSFNIQHWRFIAVTDAAKKEALTAAAYGQQKVAASAVTFIILGDLKGHAKLPDISRRSVDAGLLPQAVADQWIEMANGMYGGSEAFARDEAIRSGSMAAMTLMLAAQAMGLVSGPMIGFDPVQVKALFNIADQYVPVMLLPVGYPAPGNVGRKPRLGVDEVLSFNAARIF